MLFARRAGKLALAFPTYVGLTIKRTNIVFCFAGLASVARVAPQVHVAICIAVVPELTGGKGAAGQVLLAR